MGALWVLPGGFITFPAWTSTQLSWARSLWTPPGDSTTLPAQTSTLVLVYVAGRLGTRLGGKRAGHLAEALIATSSLHLESSTDLRMYGLLALLGAWLFHEFLDTIEGRPKPARLALVVALGLSTHYHFIHALSGAVCLTVLVTLEPARRRAILPRLGLGIFGGLLLWSPWGVYGFLHQVFGHSLAPGTSTVHPLRVLQGFVHLSFHRTNVLGASAHLWLLPLAGLALGSAAGGVLTSVRRAPSISRLVLTAWFTFGIVLWSGVAAWLSPRAGFEYRYLVVSLAPFAVAVAVGLTRPGAFERARTIGLCLLVGASGTLSIRLALDTGREDYRTAVESILDRSRATDGVLAADWQPRIFPRSIGWRFYAPKLKSATQSLPIVLDHTPDFEFVEPDGKRPERVFVLTRSVPGNVGFFEALDSTHQRVGARRFGRAVWVVEYLERGLASAE